MWTSYNKKKNQPLKYKSAQNWRSGMSQNMAACISHFCFLWAGWSRGHHLILSQSWWWGEIVQWSFIQLSGVSGCLRLSWLLLFLCRSWWPPAGLCSWSNGTGSRRSALGRGGPSTMCLWPAWPLTAPLPCWQQVRLKPDL